MKYKIYPDLLVLGKALGNGYPITSVLGKKKYLKKASKSFISSTFWTENSGFSAALKTLEIINKKKIFNSIKNNGVKIKNIWRQKSIKYNIPITIYGLDSIPTFKFSVKNSLKYKTFFTQEMLKEGILATNTIYVSAVHTKKYINLYAKKIDEIFFKLQKCEQKELSINRILKFKVASSDFNRLTS